MEKKMEQGLREVSKVELPTVVKEVSFMKGYFVEFYADVSPSMRIKIERLLKETDKRKQIDILTSMIKDWNFAEENEKGKIVKLPITKEAIMDSLTTKTQNWLGQTAVDIVSELAVLKKK